jgi:hypothetical protein
MNEAGDDGGEAVAHAEASFPKKESAEASARLAGLGAR